MFSIIDSVMGNTYGKIAVVDFGIQWACWAVASLLKTEKFYDLAGKCSRGIAKTTEFEQYTGTCSNVQWGLIAVHSSESLHSLVTGSS